MVCHSFAKMKLQFQRGICKKKTICLYVILSKNKVMFSCLHA